MIYLQLFWAFFQIGLFSIGGGYAAMPMIQSQVVSSFGWLTMAEFADVVTISEMTPGPITLNAATFVGTQVAGIPGALAATFGCIVPSCIIVTTLAVLYKKFSRANTARSFRPASRCGGINRLCGAYPCFGCFLGRRIFHKLF